MNRVLNKPSHFVAICVALFALAWLSYHPARTGAEAQAFDVPQVDYSQAKALIDAGALVLDVREQAQFDYRHVPGAMLVPLTVLHSGIPLSLIVAKDKTIVVYCNDGHTRGPEATHILRQAGFTKAVNMKSGIEGWAGAGLLVDHG